MQRVHWESLPVASQHHGLYLSCVSIAEIYQSLQVFRDDSHTSEVVLESFSTIEDHLLHRASLRAAILYPLEFRQLLEGGKHDTTYSARDLLQLGSGEVRSHDVARSIYLLSPRTSSVVDIYSKLEKAAQPVIGCNGHQISQRYSRDWLNPNLSDDLLPIYDSCRRSDMERNRFPLLFSLSAMTYGSPHLDEVVRALVSFAVVPRFKNENPPTHTNYILSDKYSPAAQTLCNFVSSCAVPFNKSPEISVQEYRSRIQRDTTVAVTKLTVGWPCRTPPPCDFLDKSLYNLETLHSKSLKLFISCYQNLELKLHLDRVRSLLGQTTTAPAKWPSYIFKEGTWNSLQIVHEITMTDLLRRTPPTMPPAEVIVGINVAPIPTPSAPWSSKLRQLIDTFRRGSGNSFRIKYAGDLHQSEVHSMHHSTSLLVPPAPDQLDQFENYYIECRERYIQGLVTLTDSLAPQTNSERAIKEAGLWPRIVPKALLGCIASTSEIKMPLSWRHCFISFAKLGLEYQRSRRARLLAMRGQFEDLYREISNIGCDGWEAEAHPDWLLIQVGINPRDYSTDSHLVFPVGGKFPYSRHSSQRCK